VWRPIQEHHPQVQVALGVALVALLLVASLIGSGSSAPAASGTSTVSARELGAVSGAQGKRGKRGERGPRGFHGPRGPEGREGAQGPQGINAGPARQFITIDWQNGDHSGRDRQSFVAPGIGTGEVRCSPPTANEPTGVQWIRFYPYDSGTATQGPANWNTTMWTVRNGGNLGSEQQPADPSHLSVVRTARLDRPNQVSGFNESMNTQTVGYDVRSTGMFTGLITTEPLRADVTKPPSTSFRLTWHWDFGEGYDNPNARCFMAGTFLTKGT
jgi:hypothetical protein